ncbi:MAG: symporter small accessory protein [Eubacteriales bacterium]
MLGMGDFQIFSVYTLCILSALLCIGYGLLKWNKGDEPTSQEIKKEEDWDKKEIEISENLDV